MKTKQSSLNYVAPAWWRPMILTSPASAGDQIFEGRSGSVISITSGRVHRLRPSATGNATQLGRFTGTAEFVLDVCHLTYVGSYVLQQLTATVSQGLSLELDANGCQGVFDNTEIAL
jgi:hypothetical protein